MYETLIQIIADGAVIPVALLGAWALLFQLPKGHRLQAYCRILMAGLTAYLIAKLVGTVYQPSAERPFELLGTQPGASYLDNPGFPSDHALFVGAITVAVWAETRKKVLASILLGLTLVVCLGRVLALVHTPFDVVAGLAIAGVGGLWYLTAPKQHRTANASKKRPLQT